MRTSSERFGHGRGPVTTGRADLLPKGPIPWASRRLNLTKLRSPFGHGIELRYRRCCIGGAPMTVSLNDLLLFSCLVALATRLL